MPKLANKVVEEIIKTLKSEKYNNCTEISNYINELFSLKTNRKTISNINIGHSHPQDNIEYPISKKYARGFLTTCCICGQKSRATYDGKEYCRKHYMQMYHHDEILTETIYDKNEYVEYDDYVEIILKNQFFEEVGRTLIDKEDKEKVLKYKWYCYQCDSLKKYCQGTLEHGFKIRLHHFVLDVGKNELNGQVVDHINGNSLDNRKSNLRIVSQKENMRNMKPQDPMKGIKYYTLKNGEPRYNARITVNYQTISLGTFKTLEEAQRARRDAEEYYKSKK